MPEPKLGKYPLEYFGHVVTDFSKTAKDHQGAQFCPFLQSECKKPRKSDPGVKTGICTVGYKARFMDRLEPVSICPHRFNTSGVFDFIANHYFPVDDDWLLQWVPEVAMGLAGSVDYVLAKSKREDPAVIDDFICVEVQAAGTVGTPWEAILDFQNGGAFTQQNYDYGINWANEYAKTMMQQVYKEGMILESWGKRLVVVLQDVGMKYLRSGLNDISGLNDPANDDDLIQFYTMRMVWEEVGNKWEFVPAEILGSNLEGVRKMLAGSAEDNRITLQGFCDNIIRRSQ